MKSWTKAIQQRYGVCLVSNPHPQSPGALAKLCYQYGSSDDTLYDHWAWWEFKKTLQAKWNKIGKPKICFHCKVGLTIHNLTFDHLIPMSKGGGVYDETNIEYACKTCNSTRHGEEQKLERAGLQ